MMSEYKDCPSQSFTMTENIERFLSDLKKDSRKITKDINWENTRNSKETACETIKLMEKIVSHADWETAKDLMEIVHNAGEKLVEGSFKPLHTVIGSMSKRVLKIIRDEYSTACGQDFDNGQQESLQKILTAGEGMDYTRHLPALRKSISANLRELMEEVERSSRDIVGHSSEVINSGDCIMTYGYSKTVERFLRSASHRDISVYVCQAWNLGFTGNIMAVKLAEAGIETRLIPDQGIAMFMEKMNKVIVGAHTILADGGIKTTCGINDMALCARRQRIPFIVLAPNFKITNEIATSSRDEGFNFMLSPELIIEPEHAHLFSKNVTVINPAFDYIKPDNVSLIISNVGPNTPSYIYRTIQELYHPDDEF